jgi:hypothetical protein
MSEDIIGRRARALEAVLGGPAPAATPTDADDALDEVVPGEVVPGDVASGDVVPGEVVPGELAPAATESMMTSRIGALLAHPGTWQQPPALPAELLAEIRADAADESPQVSPARTDTAPAAPAADRPRRRWWPQLRWTAPRTAFGLAGALVAILLVVVMFGGDFLLPSDESNRPVTTIQLAGTSIAPRAHARVQAVERDAGWRLVLDIDGLAPAPPDRYYQGWAVRGREYVPLGTFHMHKPGQVELWSGVPLRMFSRIEVTEQRVGAGNAPGVLVMVGQT